MKSSLAELLHDQVRDLYDAEIQYRHMLPGMIDRSTSEDLASFLRDTARQTQEAIDGITEASSALGIEANGVTCEAMEGLILETRRNTNEVMDSATQDAAIISNAQRIAHYEIAGFGTACAFAKSINNSHAASIFGSLAAAAGKRDQALTKLATGGWFLPGINDEAAAA